MAFNYDEYLRTDKMPTLWCWGCGDGVILKSIIRAIEKTGWNMDDVCVVSGIGCSGRTSSYINCNTVHTTHGRTLAYATGIKLANPDLKVIVISGDGDASAIGGNHLIHAARRNIDITTVVYNNNIYGMTGGQYSPTTPKGEKGTTAPYGNIDNNFDLCKLAQGAGATFTGRSTVYHAKMLTDLIRKGIENKGFSFVESRSLCPTYYGRKNKKGSVVDMMNYLKDNAVMQAKADKMTEEEMASKFVIGELYNKPDLEYTEQYQKIIDMFSKER